MKCEGHEIEKNKWKTSAAKMVSYIGRSHLGGNNISFRNDTRGATAGRGVEPKGTFGIKGVRRRKGHLQLSCQH